MRKTNDKKQSNSSKNKDCSGKAGKNAKDCK